MIVESKTIRPIKGCVAGTVMPFAVLRRAGLSAEPFERLIFHRSSATVDRLLGLENTCAELAARLPEVLHTVLGTIQSSAFTAEILQLRRDIHNHRASRKALSSGACALLTDTLSPAQLEH